MMQRWGEPVTAIVPMPESCPFTHDRPILSASVNTLISQAKSLSKSMRLNWFNVLRNIMGLSDVKERLMSRIRYYVTYENKMAFLIGNSTHAV